MNPDAVDVAAADTRTLAATLAPLLAQACDDRLGAMTWFKADWQRGGAATGYSTFRSGDDGALPVVVKLPVVQRELLWTRRLQHEDQDDQAHLVVPRLLASGESLGGYDLAWIVIERFEHGPLGLKWHEDHLARIAEASAAFAERAAPFPVDQPPRCEDWESLIRDARQSVEVNQIAQAKRWRSALQTVEDHLDRLVADWRARRTDEWIHGDLHLANAMSRVAFDRGPVSLIDLAEVRAGHWVEDAVYLERQLWARPERMKPVKPVKAIAAARRARGLPVEKDAPRLAMIRRCLLAATAPKFIKSEGHPSYLEACLERLEIALAELT